ncbi:MAG: hypothetical protein LUQ40_01315 [Methanomicrobiales archaeon]|nr:hypothetical protein [Methanomicrobiales archaeon]
MKIKAVILTGLFLVAIVLVAACTGTSNGTQTPTATPVGTTIPTSVRTTLPPTTGTSLTPGPTDVMPPNLQAEFQVDQKDPIYAQVKVTYRGGTASTHITHIDVRFTLADGTVISKTIPESGNRKVQVGDEVIMQGTRFTDRLQVTVTLDNGVVYRVIDQLVPYQTRP